jgi:hypothetical protein
MFIDGDVSSAANQSSNMWSTAYRGVQLAAFGFSSGQNNGATTSSDVQLTSYNVTIPANLLTQAGDAILVAATWYGLGVAAATRVAKMQIDSTTIRTKFSTSTSLANMIMPTYVWLRYRTSTTGSYTGISWVDASGASAATGVPYLMNAGLTSADWTSSQTLKFFANSSVASSLGLTDLSVMFFPSITGTLV